LQIVEATAIPHLAGAGDRVHDGMSISIFRRSDRRVAERGWQV
jgi:hypothetical protein